MQPLPAASVAEVAWGGKAGAICPPGLLPTPHLPQREQVEGWERRVPVFLQSLLAFCVIASDTEAAAERQGERQARASTHRNPAFKPPPRVCQISWSHHSPPPHPHTFFLSEVTNGRLAGADYSAVTSSHKHFLTSLVYSACC